MLLDAAGHVQPPADILARLQQIDPRLGLTLSSTVDPATDRIRDAWAFTMGWMPDDPRQRYVQDGSTPPDRAFDVLSFLPFDMGVDEAYGYVVKTFKQLKDKPDVHRMLDRVHAYNSNNRKAILKETVELGEELAEANVHRIRSHAVRKNRVERPGQGERNLREFLDQ